MATPVVGLAPAVSSAFVRPELRAAVATLDPRLADIAGYHFGWVDADGAPRDADGGKMLRATLVLLSAKVCGADPQRAVPGAVAVELVHNFSLLHDDVMDGDHTRRHRPTAWTLFGMPAAILVGDALVTLALEVLYDSSPARERAGQCLAGAVQRLCGGQLSDLSFERRTDVSLTECLTMAADKTGALISAACAIGATLAEAPAGQVAALSRFGEHLGLAFQLADDLLGIWGDPAVTGKPVMADLRARKKSIPVVATMSGTTAVARRFAALYAQPELGDDDLVLARTLIEEAGGKAWVETEIARQVDAATACLDALGDVADLLSILDLATKRDR